MSDSGSEEAERQADAQREGFEAPFPPETFEPVLSGSPDQKGSCEALQNRVLAAIPERVKSARQGARERGERYYMGAQCHRGHRGLRYVSNGVCVECVVKEPAWNRGGPRKSAAVRGDRYYFGAECHTCGGRRRYVSNHHCVRCGLRDRAEQKEYHRLYQRRRNQTHPEQQRQISGRSRRRPGAARYPQSNAEVVRQNTIKEIYYPNYEPDV